ncbi:hypothetical protein ACWDAO_09525 [Streptomyces sp. NPDC001212]|uniref:hypothetical protein n=1 Tax=unclassified Streptomyces TaxID=2593676 RepID=UPI00248034A6|nr:hypothetical protein [Streptomyces sp. HYC2]
MVTVIGTARQQSVEWRPFVAFRPAGRGWESGWPGTGEGSDAVESVEADGDVGADAVHDPPQQQGVMMNHMSL